MKPAYKILFIALFLHFSNQAQTFIKVLLADAATSKQTVWRFTSNQKFCLTIPDIKSSSLGKKYFDSLTIEIRNNKIYVNGKHYKYSSLKLRPTCAPIAINNNLYDGCFIIEQHNKQIFLINQVELEDYICSVLKTESWPGWPKEVNKAFAIASRSYVLAQALRARKNKLPYHIKNNNHHQTYSGIHNEATLKHAVLETKGIILGYNGDPILAMFDICCGGVIPAHIDGFDFESHPYLARTTACTHCKSTKAYSWQASYTNHDFKQILKSILPNINNIKKIATKTDKAGTVKSLTVHGSKESYHIDARTMYSLFKDIKSWCYSICHHADTIKLDGTGFGHHLGICQWGAREMINKGYSYRDILQFYYPSTKFMKFKD